MTADFPDWNLPQGSADAIAITGVPLLHRKTSITTPAAIPVGAGSFIGLPTLASFYNFQQVAYEIYLSLATAAGTATRVGVSLFWNDSTSATIIRRVNVACYAGSTGNPHNIIGQGPTRADQLQVFVQAPDNAITVSGAVLQRSSLYVKDQWRTTIASALPVFPGFGTAMIDPDSGYLASASQLITASNFDNFLLPLYSGLVTIAGTTTDATAGNSELRVAAVSEVFGSPAANLLYRLANGQEDTIHPQFIRGTGLALPAVQCELFLVNNNASTSETITANVMAHEIAAG